MAKPEGRRTMEGAKRGKTNSTKIPTIVPKIKDKMIKKKVKRRKKVTI